MSSTTHQNTITRIWAFAYNDEAHQIILSLKVFDGAQMKPPRDIAKKDCATCQCDWYVLNGGDPDLEQSLCHTRPMTQSSD